MMPKKVQSFDGSWVNDRMPLPCGSVAEFDGEFSYRCWSCMAIVGSIAEPAECKREADKYRVMEMMGGKGWDYNIEIEE